MFSQQTLDFLSENRLRNSKEWFEAHREDYRRHVFTPLAELVTALTPTMRGIDDGLICEAKVDKSVSRIYRDVRFSKDKSLYREEQWCVFTRNKKLYEGPPEFFFVISPKSWLYGTGYYQTSAEAMESIRGMILKNDPDFQKAQAAYENLQNDFHMDGELRKRSKYPDQPEKLRNWLDRKSIAVMRESADFGMLFSERLADTVGKDYRRLAPVYYFFIKAESGKNGGDSRKQG